MKLVQTLPDGPLDIVGDIHGELDALRSLLTHLGYQPDGFHPGNRKLVFVGDFCDRGSDSPGVIFLVQKLVQSGSAFAILGNHEINVLMEDAKDGSGWFFDTRYASDLPYYAPFKQANDVEKEQIRTFLNTLPIAFERSDIRIVHAAWQQEAIDAIRPLRTGDIARYYREWNRLAESDAKQSGLWDRYHGELEQWKSQIEDQENPPPFLHAVAQYEALQHVHNPFKVLTSGVEAQTDTAFFSGNRWRFSDRLPWWDDYDDPTPVVIGHYWRLFQPRPDQPQSRYSLLFRNLESTAWHGKRKNVFCVDYSVGARWRDRKAGGIGRSRFRLAALQWPEMRLVFDEGDAVETKIA